MHSAQNKKLTALQANTNLRFCRRRLFFPGAVLVFGMFAASCHSDSHTPQKIVLQSAHAGAVKKLLLVYTWSAEMGVVSLRDMLAALPGTEALIVNQFPPNSGQFSAFVSNLTRGGLGRDAAGRPLLQFVQDARPFGPWPRDQALVDESGAMWISASDNHRLRDLMLALDRSYGLDNRAADFRFTGANLLRCGNVILCPDRLDTTYLAQYLRGPFVALPSPPPPEPFHLDLLVMPLSDRLIAVGDDALARAALAQLAPEQQQRLVARWLAEFAVSAHNLELLAEGGNFRFLARPRPALILAANLKEKLDLVAGLLRQGNFQKSVEATPAYEWDDRIAAALVQKGFEVLRLPFWPAAGASLADSASLPMMCYPNCLVWDEGILMPVYGVAALDDFAAEILQRATKKKVHPVRGGALLGYGSSGPHCLTLEFRHVMP